MIKHEGWFWDSITQDFYRWKDIPYELKSYWTHFCGVETTNVIVKEGLICGSCGISFEGLYRE